MAYEINSSALFRPVIDKGAPHNHYCGPHSITAITGVPISRVEQMIKRMRKSKSAVKGTHTWEVLKCLKRLGCRTEEIKTFEPTLGKFRDDLGPTPHTYLVMVNWHWTVVRKGEKRDETSDRKKVLRAWIVKAPAKPRYATGATPRKRSTKPKPTIVEVRAKRVDDQLKKWKSKFKRAQTAIKKLTRQQSYYAKKRAEAGTSASIVSTITSDVNATTL